MPNFNPYANTSRLQRQNDKQIFTYINGLERNTPQARGEDVETTVLGEILYSWGVNVTKQIRETWAAKGFNEASTMQHFEPSISTEGNNVTSLILAPTDDKWIWAENGRKAGKRPPVAPLQKWIAYRGINLDFVRKWQVKRKLKDGKTVISYPYKSLNNIRLNKVFARAVSISIGRKGTIKRFGYKGSHFLTEVVNQQELDKLAAQIAEAVGYEVAITLTFE